MTTAVHDNLRDLGLIPGTSSVGHLRENLAATDFELSEEVMTALDRIADDRGSA